jgi:cell division protein FtsI/penicillin-binding protein 2
MKLVTAEAALAQGQTPTYHCTGHDVIHGKKMFCWNYHGHGWVDFSRALSLSCNLYFARLGNQIGLAGLLKTLSTYSFSDLSRITEKKIPAEEVALLAIGDSKDFRVTSREIVQFWDKFLNRLADPSYSVIEQGLRRAVREGTGRKATISNFEILGKTGTGDSENSIYKTDGWFLGAYPPKNPRYAMVVFLKQAHGYEEAATLAGKIFSLGLKTGYFER